MSLFNIIFENAHLIAVDKPGGWLSVPSRKGAQDPRPCLGIELQKRQGQQIFPVHRLDEETTGLIMFAKTTQAHSLLSVAFEHGKINKTYNAITHESNINLGHTQVFKDTILRGKKRSYLSPVGKLAITHATPKDLLHIDDKSFLFWELVPQTGRSHQLRFQLARRGFPIWGDHLYGSSSPFKVERTIALRATALTIPSELSSILDIPQGLQAEPLLKKLL